MRGKEQPSKEIFWIYPCRVGLSRKNSKFSSSGQGWWEKSQNLPRQGTPSEAKSGFQTRGILARPRPVRPYPAKGCLGEKMPGLTDTCGLNFRPQVSVVFRKKNFRTMTATPFHILLELIVLSYYFRLISSFNFWWIDFFYLRYKSN